MAVASEPARHEAVEERRRVVVGELGATISTERALISSSGEQNNNNKKKNMLAMMATFAS